jgi:hypothetical protein
MMDTSHNSHSSRRPSRGRPLLLFLAALAGCASLTPAERAAQMEREVDEMIQVYGPACEKLGYKPDSDAWRTCILQLNAGKAMERYQSRPQTTQCWGHRGFYNCTSF